MGKKKPRAVSGGWLDYKLLLLLLASKKMLLLLIFKDRTLGTGFISSIDLNWTDENYLSFSPSCLTFFVLMNKRTLSFMFQDWDERIHILCQFYICFSFMLRQFLRFYFLKGTLFSFSFFAVPTCSQRLEKSQQPHNGRVYESVACTEYDCWRRNVLPVLSSQRAEQVA